MTHHINPRMRRRTLACVAGLFVALASPLLALAAYPPGSFPGAAPGGAFSTVIISQNVCAAGGTIRASYGAASLTLTIPAGAFSTCRQVTIYGVNAGIIAPLLPKGHVLVVALAVGWQPGGDAAALLTLKVEQPGIAGDDTAYVTTVNGLAKLTEMRVLAGSASATFTTPPGLVLSHAGAAPTPAGRPGAGGTVPDAESDGPVLYALALAGSLAVVVVIAFAVVRRQRRLGAAPR
jgi:hypothetical protein